MKERLDPRTQEGGDSLRIALPDRRPLQETQSSEETLGTAPAVQLQAFERIARFDLQDLESLFAQDFAPSLRLDDVAPRHRRLSLPMHPDDDSSPGWLLLAAPEDSHR